MLIENTLLLRERFPAVRRYFLENEDEIKQDQLQVLESRSGKKTIRYETSEHKQLMIHSLYDPIKEAERIIASHQDKIKSDTHVFFYGVGMGHHIENFLEKFPNNTYSIYEPMPEVFLAMTKQKHLNSIVTKNIRQLYLDTHEDSNTEYIQEFLSNNKNIHLVTLPSYENIAKEKLTEFREIIKKVILNRRTALHVNNNYQKYWVKNSLYNFMKVLNTPNITKDIDKSRFEGKPAMIISAGPSLAEDIEQIRYIKENNLAYIFSVGSAINSLIEYDLLPDAVLTFDPSQNNHKVFEKMISKEINQIPMVFGSSVGYETLEKFKGPKVHFLTSQDKTSLYFIREQLELERDLIIDSPSIAVMTFQILNKIGADPIIFAGQNLGYWSNRLYSKGIEYEHIKSTVEEKNLDNAPTTKDVYGNEIKTSVSFNNMRESIEAFAKKYKDKTFINTTKNGAAIDGVPFQSIEKVIKNILIEPIEKKVWWDSENTYNQIDLEGKAEKLNQSVCEFYDILSTLENLLDEINTYSKLKNMHKIQILLTQFDNFYNQITENMYFANFLSFYIRVHIQILDNEIKRLNQERNSIIKGKEIVPIFRNFIQQCKTGGEELEKEIEINVSKFK